jgi:signal transduction histidine kinase
VLRSNKAARTMLKRQTITHISQVSDRLTAFSSRESHTTLQGKKVMIMAFSDIHGELANQEIDAWVKLIRVLTHEIMNTITPVIALSDTSTESSEEQKKLRIIHSTSVELMEFVENYRKFTHVPTPHPTLFYVKPFVARLANLAEHWLKPGCAIHVNIEPQDLMVYADEGLTSRVVSNLIKNAAEAIGNDGSIMIHAYTGEHDNVTIDISDDGSAIPPDLAAHIFVPFFTTKKQGSGIGLSISRQIMRTMGGMIELVSNTEPTTFRLTFQ